MSDQEGYDARGCTPASNLREEPRGAVGRKRASKPPPWTVPNTSRLRPAEAASCVPLPIEKGADMLFSQGAV